MMYETALNFLKRERKELKGRSTVLSEWLQVVRGIGSPTREDRFFATMGIKKVRSEKGGNIDIFHGGYSLRQEGR